MEWKKILQIKSLKGIITFEKLRLVTFFLIHPHNKSRFSMFYHREKKINKLEANYNMDKKNRYYDS